MKSTRENLRNHATKSLAQLLIHSAKRRSSTTYGEAKYVLETETGFDTIFSTMMGVPAGELNNRFLAVRPGCPPLTVLLVRQADGMPGQGAGPFLADYLRDERLRSPRFRSLYPGKWRAACEQIAASVYATDEWDDLYRRAFGERLPTPSPPNGREVDGIRYGRAGEGRNHKALRLWTKQNPCKIKRVYAAFRSETEVVLDSADRVDVVYYGPHTTVVLEVKSRDSDTLDLRRGVFQCIKYRAVMRAMDIRSNPDVVAFLVTETELPTRLQALCRLHDLQHFHVPNPE